MTLLRTILTARTLGSRPLPDRRPREGWPADTRHTADDVVVAGRSLLELALTRGTPAVLVCSGEDSTPRMCPTTLILYRIVSVDASDPESVIAVNGQLPAGSPAAAGRVLGRASSAKQRSVALRSADPATRVRARVAGDVAPGDIIVLPYAGTVPLSQVKARAVTVAPADPEEDDWRARCMR